MLLLYNDHRVGAECRRRGPAGAERLFVGAVVALKTKPLAAPASALGGQRLASQKVPLTAADPHARPPRRLSRVQTGVGGAPRGPGDDSRTAARRCATLHPAPEETLRKAGKVRESQRFNFVVGPDVVAGSPPRRSALPVPAAPHSLAAPAGEPAKEGGGRRRSFLKYGGRGTGWGRGEAGGGSGLTAAPSPTPARGTAVRRGPRSAGLDPVQQTG
ncbi:unnamed protein product [Rangifer tarandus platyrhynchus]|uniref:Uncharacterized protein n=1 Tax=Rangifer tarandus platyrhynchus TaxID=3082113 RepID=A0ABN8Z2G1_RANTA|nr:unnamed protein product [Rangifer tarandus platyrhynchus]